ASVTILPVEITKSLSTSTSGPFVPGDLIVYQLELDIPSGDAEGVVIEDFFPLPILDLVEMGFVPNIGAGGNIRPITGAGYLGVAPNNATVIPSTNSLRLTFPDVDEATGNKIGVEVEVNVVDIPFADDLFHSNIVLSETSNSATVTAFDVDLNLVKVFAPSLEITKGVFATNNPNATLEPVENPINADASDVDAGDQITYQTTIVNTGGAIAYDVLITDQIPAQLTNCALISVTQGNGSTPISTSGDLFGNGLAISQLAANDGNDNTGADMALLRYSCTCTTAVEPRQELDNTASVTWASLPNADRFPAQTDDAKVTIANPEIFKFVEKLSPRYSGNDTRVQIGDTVFYVLNLLVPEGTNANLEIRDQLSTGLELIEVTEVIAPTGVTTDVTGGYAAIEMTTPTDGQNISLDFGTITNANSDNNVEDFITIKYTALVRNITYNGQNINTTTGLGRALRNEAKLFYDGNQTNNVRTTVRIVESIVDIEKRYTASNNPNAAIDTDGDLMNAMAGDMVTYEVVVTNTGSGSMIDAKLLDLDDMLRNCTLTGLVDQAGNSVAHTISNDTILFTNPIPPMSSVTATYDCEIIPSVNPGQIIDNNATIFFDPLAGSTTAATDEDNAIINVAAPKIEVEKIDISPGYSGNLAGAQIGEIVTYRATIEIPRGTSNEAIFMDLVDEGLAFVDVISVTASPNLSTTEAAVFSDAANLAVISDSGNGSLAADRKLTLDFGTIRNTDIDNSTTETIVIEYRAMVLNTTANVRDQALNDNVTWQWENPNTTDPNAPPLVINDNETVTVIEPELQIMTEFTNPSIDLQDETFVTLTISHTDASNGDAKDIMINNVLPFGMQFIPGSFSTTCATTPTFTDDTSPSTGGMVNAFFEDFPLGSECTISYRVEHDPASAECDNLDNCADVSYESIAAVDQAGLMMPPTNQFGVERTGDVADAGQLNNYTTQDCAMLQITNGLTADPFISTNSPVCEGGRAVLENETEYQGSLVTYRWFGPNGEITNDNFQLIIDPVAPSDAGDYYAVVTVDGCATDQSNTVDLQVGTKPTTPTASVGNNGTYCAGENVQLFANGDPNNTYQWTGPNGFSSTAQNPIIVNATSVDAGMYAVQAFDAAGCASDQSNSVTVAINAQPSAPTISNNSPICADGTTDVTLTPDNVPNGATVQWYNASGNLLDTGNSYIIEDATTANAGNYYAILIVNGCASEPSATTEVIIDETPNETAFAGEDQTYCEGITSVNLAATMPVNGTGMWTVSSANSGAIAVSPMNPQTSVTNLQSGTYTFTWSLSNGVCLDYSTDEVTIQIGGNLAAPTATSTSPVCEGETLTLTATDVPTGASIEWTGPNGFTSSAAESILENVTTAVAGDY
ncbi:MAG: isopeptide-forming domain-containing fimbrial protein, partial [Saprospiraceae bacterium]